MKKVDLVGLVVDATSGAPVVVLREQDDPHRLLPIFVGQPEAAAIALAVHGQAPPRPLTHDLMAAIVTGLGGEVEAVEVTELRDGAFLARLAVHGPAGDQRFDTRPSDAIALAIRLGAPLLVADAVLDEAGTVPAVEMDEVAIDEAVDEFRAFLDEIGPAHFTDEATEPASATTDPSAEVTEPTDEVKGPSADDAAEPTDEVKDPSADDAAEPTDEVKDPSADDAAEPTDEGETGVDAAQH